MICRASHSAVGCRVTSNHSSCRRPWPRTRNANKRSKVRVGTTHRSMAAIACAWFRRNVFQLCEGGVPPRTMYLETVDWATAKPSIRSSPWIRDAPHSGFSSHPLNEITQATIDLRAPCPLSRFPAPESFPARATPPKDRLRFNDLGRTEQARPELGHPDQQRPVTATQSKARRCLPQSDVELMTDKQVLRLKPA